MYRRLDGCIATPPFIYFIQSGLFVKIGLTEGAIGRRLDQIQTCNPAKVYLLAAIEGSAEAEIRWHVEFEEAWVRGEWFKLSEKLRASIAKAARAGLVLPKRRAITSKSRNIKMQQRRTRLGKIPGLSTAHSSAEPASV